MNTSTVRADEAAIARPKYYEMDGALRANANRAWLLAFLTIPIALVAIGFVSAPTAMPLCWAILRRALCLISPQAGPMSSWMRRS
jgi:hypothetical protein